MADSNDNKKLGVIALAALVVSAMIGGGIFSLPQNMAASASVMAVIIAWVITGIGMYFIANTFRILADARPDATTGIYAYARLGFGRFAGFQMAWAYWLCNIFGNVGFAVLLMDAFNYFFPGTFTGGNNLYSIIGGSIVIWGMNFMVLARHEAGGLHQRGRHHLQARADRAVHPGSCSSRSAGHSSRPICSAPRRSRRTTSSRWAACSARSSPR